jgi:hypothetical protein
MVAASLQACGVVFPLLIPISIPQQGHPKLEYLVSAFEQIVAQGRVPADRCGQSEKGL